MKEPLIIAHRGASALAPENTSAAFTQAIKDGADGIEFDVRFAKDGVPVVFHDEDLIRVLKKEILVRNLTSKELSEFDVGSWFNTEKPEFAHEKFAIERISTLEETLEFLKDYKGIIYIELKCGGVNVEQFCKSVCDVVARSKAASRIIIKSFNLSVVPLIKKHCPEVRTAALFAPKIMLILRKEKRLIETAIESGADRLSLHFSLATNKLMEKATEKNLSVAIWTVDSPRWIKRSIKLGIEHIITNDPAKLLQKRHNIVSKGSIIA